MKYRIHWKALRTNATGAGSKFFPKDQAEAICADMNEYNSGTLHYWIEAVPEKEDEQPVKSVTNSS